jgi:hypothetical protein
MRDAIAAPSASAPPSTSCVAAMRDRAAEGFNLDGAANAADLAPVLARWGM